MRKFTGLYTLCIFLAAAAVNAQDEELPVFMSEHYEIHCNAADAQNLLPQMESNYAMYNSIFRFNPDTPLLKITAFSDTEQYDEYINARIGSVQPGALYLHHTQAELRELVIDLPVSLSGESDALPYQSFVQFLRSSVAYPPMWIQEGFAMYFYATDYNPGRETVFTENLDWLNTVSGIQDLPSAVSLMQCDADNKPANFQEMAWSLVSFFMNGGRNGYRQKLSGSLSALSGVKAAEENTETFIGSITGQGGAEQLNRDFLSYVKSRVSYTQLLEKGRLEYSENRPNRAKVAFESALELKPDSDYAMYYLGLLAYDVGESENAEQYYLSAIKNGADSALVYYALGLNSFSAGQWQTAAEYLQKAGDADPERYREKTNTLIKKMGE